MATTKNLRVKGDATKPYDAAGGRCPECGVPVHAYVPPDRSLGGPAAYPALLIHIENAHTGYSGGKPQGWPVPPPPPMIDEVKIDEESGKSSKTGKKVTETWETDPPKPEDWVPINKFLAEKNLPQEDSVWPPVRIQQRPQ